MYPHPHFLRELKKEGLELPDAMVVLKNGNVFDEPELDIKFQQWRYRMEGKEPGGKRLKIVFAFLAEDEAILITVFSVAT